MDILPYISWTSGESEEEEDDDIGYGCFDTDELVSHTVCNNDDQRKEKSRFTCLPVFLL